MERHDPLSTIAPAEQVPTPTPAAFRKSRKRPPLLREVAEVKDDTLAFLYGGAEQQTDDYKRNLEQAGKIREDFVQFCSANAYFSNWRQAWAAFAHNQPEQPTSEPISASSYLLPVKTPARPRWKARFFQSAGA